jgi:hypothetical protein
MIIGSSHHQKRSCLLLLDIKNPIPLLLILSTRVYVHGLLSLNGLAISGGPNFLARLALNAQEYLVTVLGLQL